MKNIVTTKSISTTRDRSSRPKHVLPQSLFIAIGAETAFPEQSAFYATAQYAAIPVMCWPRISA
jgi:hypothetical protein